VKSGPGPEEAGEGRHRAGAATARVFGGIGRPSAAALAQEHEAARMQAKLMDPETAVCELADRLTFAHVNAGKPPLGVLSEAVHYSKGTLSKVFAGKMLPSWPLVEDLADVLRVPTDTVLHEWFHLWTAAKALRRKTGAVRAAVQPVPGTAVTSGTGHPCPECGSWIVDPARHAEWHRQIGEAGRGGPASGSVADWAQQARPFTVPGPAGSFGPVHSSGSLGPVGSFGR
jgi:hypothetical protein